MESGRSSIAALTFPIIAFLCGKIKEQCLVEMGGGGKLQFNGGFEKPKEYHDPDVRRLPHRFAEPPLGGGLIPCPAEICCPISDFAPRPKAPSGRELPPAGG